MKSTIKRYTAGKDFADVHYLRSNERFIYNDGRVDHFAIKVDGGAILLDSFGHFVPAKLESNRLSFDWLNAWETFHDAARAMKP